MNHLLKSGSSVIGGVSLELSSDGSSFFLHQALWQPFPGELMAVSLAALTIYDMCKVVDKGMVISNIRLLQKRGGKSGTYIRKE